MNISFLSTLTSLCFPFLLMAHVVDIHVKTPSEIAQEERIEKERENDRAREIYEDDSLPEEERREALRILVENEEIV